MQSLDPIKVENKPTKDANEATSSQLKAIFFLNPLDNGII